jgi:hypothetical protein
MPILAAISLALVPQDEPREASPLSRLTSMHISVDFTQTTLPEAIDYFREATDLNFHIDAKVAKAGDIRITARLKQVRVVSALRLILAQHDLAAVLRDGIVVVTPRAEVERKVVTFAYDIRDLDFSIRDFPGPRIELEPRPSGEAGPEVKFVLFDGPATPPSREEGILELIRASTGGTTWDDNPHAKIQIAPNGLLLVTQSIGVHQEVERLLKSLRNRR